MNSYHRLVPGFEAPVNLVYSQRNRSACVRIPITGTNPKAKRIEFRVPDPSANPYLAFSAMLMAGLDGIKNKIEPPEPVDKDLYELPPDEALAIPQVPGSLDEVLDRLEADHDYLTEGGVFTEDLIETWIEYKRSQRDRPDPAAPAPARVRALLRRVTGSGAGQGRNHRAGPVPLFLGHWLIGPRRLARREPRAGSATTGTCRGSDRVRFPELARATAELGRSRSSSSAAQRLDENHNSVISSR